MFMVQAAEATKPLWYTDTGFVSGIAGAILGAAVSGGISYLLQKSAWAQTEKDKKKDAKERQKATAYSLFFKTAEITHALAMSYNYYEKEFSKLNSSQLKEPTVYIKPLLNAYPPISFIPDELALILSFGEGDLIGDLSLLTKHYSASMSSMLEFKRVREQMLSDMSRALLEYHDDPKLDDRMRVFNPVQKGLNDALLEGRKFSKFDFDFATSTLKKLHSVISQHLRVNFDLEVVDRHAQNDKSLDLDLHNTHPDIESAIAT